MFKLKSGVKIEDLQELVPEIIIVLGIASRWCKDRNLEVVITSIISDRENIETVSDTHSTGRSVDVRTRDWRQETIDALELYLNIHCQEYEAPTKSGGGRVAYYHNNHLHLQVARKFLK